MPTITKKSKKNKVLPLAVASYADNTDGKSEKEFILKSTSEDGLPVSEEMYWKHYYEHPYFKYEWNNGILEEKAMSDVDTYHSFDWLADLLKEFLKYNPIAETFSQEIGGRVYLPNKTLIRRPDLWVKLHSNPVPLHGKEVSYQGTFDICIEAISKTTEEDKKRDTVTKKREYALGGVKEYYIIDGDKTETVFYCLNEEGTYQEIKSEDGIIRSAVLPKFQFRLTDLYKTPFIEDLRHDEVYKHFVAINLQNESNARQQEAKARQEAERKAEAEAKARQQETKARQAAEAEIERLKALLKTK